MSNNPFGNLHTLVSTDRLCNLIKYSQLCAPLGGYMASFGVYKGGSLEVLAKFNPDSDIIGIDSFEGLPAPSEYDFHAEGDFADVQFNNINGYFKTMHPRVRLFKGFSPWVFTAIEDAQFCFVEIDVDLYQSVKDGLKFFLPRMKKGGVILLDDYKVKSTPGCKIAIDEYMEDDTNEDEDCSYAQELKYFDGAGEKSHNQYLIRK